MKFGLLDDVTESPIEKVSSPVVHAHYGSNSDSHSHSHSNDGNHNITTRGPRPRPPTRLTPDAKRHKAPDTAAVVALVEIGGRIAPGGGSTSSPMVPASPPRAATPNTPNTISHYNHHLDYSTPGEEQQSRVPSKKTLRALVQEAVCRQDTNSASANASASASASAHANAHAHAHADQLRLTPAGLLSLEQVLLPALAMEEEKALKRFQAKVQRDAPHDKSMVEACRRLVRSSMLQAVQAVQEARRQRQQLRLDRRHQQRDDHRRQQVLAQQQRAVVRQQAHEEAVQVAHLARQQQFRQWQRQYPRNKELWKEIVVLTRSRTQLDKEVKLWTDLERGQLGQTQALPQPLPLPLPQPQPQEKEEEDTIPTLQAPKHDYQKQTEATIQDMVLASKRIQQGLEGVLQLFGDSQVLRQTLYQDYRRHHHFHGYQGVSNPKNLIRFLSQEE